jgi:bacterioferritin-associated ferredoxin
MYVCLCAGVTNQTVAQAVTSGASTSKQVADACGAGSECGRCRRTVRAIIEARQASAAAKRPPDDAQAR